MTGQLTVAAELAAVNPAKGTVVTVGVFDGVHRGHQRLIGQMRALADEHDLLAVVITFREHPRQLLSPEETVPSLTGIDEKIRLLKAAGADIVVPLDFTPALAALTAREFAALLAEKLRMRWLVAGPGYAAGKDREGNVDVLTGLGKEMGFAVKAVPSEEIDGGVVSSTAVRAAIAVGDMEKAGRMLGRSLRLQGKVVAGEGRGAQMGFPTANLEIDRGQALPADGVYAGRGFLNGNSYPAVANIGLKPTFDGKERTVEAYLIDYQGDLYRKELRLDIVARLRDEKKFASAEELQRQVAVDVATGRRLLESMHEG